MSKKAALSRSKHGVRFCEWRELNCERSRSESAGSSCRHEAAWARMYEGSAGT